LYRAIQAADDKLFETALEQCKTHEQKMYVFTQQADMYLRQAQEARTSATANGCYAQAARVLMKAGFSFDEAILKLLGLSGQQYAQMFGPIASSSDSNAGNNNSAGGAAQALVQSLAKQSSSFVNSPALTSVRVFLLECLQVLSQASKSQRTMLATWLCEIYLHQITCAALFPASSSPSKAGAASQKGSSSNAVGSLGGGVYMGETEAELTTQFKDFMRQFK
jgi:hypothetical protein